MKLRPYQTKINEDIRAAWASGARNVMPVMPTGSGKTIQFSKIVQETDGACCAIAHRQELVSQISLAFGKYGLGHGIVGPPSVIKMITRLHMDEFGRSFYDPNSKCMVAGVDTLIRRGNQLKRWLPQVKLWVIDEGHHILKDNKWGKAISMFPNALGLAPTATPMRADRKGLGRQFDGLIDSLVLGPTMRDLINEGYLTDYRIFCPPSDLDLQNVKISQATGDYNPNQLKVQVRKSTIIGDVVAHYLKIAPEKLGVTFATDIETATDLADGFNSAGIAAAVITSKTLDQDRFRLLRQFKQGIIKQLVNVDIFGEGFDLPALEVVSMARPTKSYGLFCQQFGRSLRPMPGKDSAIIIDHVNNAMDLSRRYGLPDAPKAWSLDAVPRVRKMRNPDEIPLRICRQCMGAYEATYSSCPYCAKIWVPDGRSKPEFVDGDLLELDPLVLEQLRSAVDTIDAPAEDIARKLRFGGAPEIAALGAAKQHKLRKIAQDILRYSISLWAGHQRARNRSDSESYKRFYWRYNTDVLTAQTLGRKEAIELTRKIQRDIETGKI